MARKNGCPMNVRNWQIDVLSRAASLTDPTWLRIKGVTSLTLSFDGDTEDGSAADSLWSEPYVSKRSGSLNIEAKPVIDAVTGAQDVGQAELDYYATQGGCDGDCTLRLADPYGHCTILTVVVTSTEKSADDTEESRSWDTEIVGEAEEQNYVQVTGITAAKADAPTTAVTSVSVAVGATQSMVAIIAPEGASNQKYSVASADSSKVRVTNIDGLNFDIVGVAATTGAVNVLLKTMNNSRTVSIAVTVTAAS